MVILMKLPLPIMFCRHIESAAMLTVCLRWNNMRKTRMLVKNVTFSCQSTYFRTFT